MKSWRGWQTSLRPAFKRDRCLADFFNFDHRFEALVGCACSRIVRGGKKNHDGTKRGWGDEMKWRGKKRQRKGNGEGWREEMKGRGRKNKMRERERERQRDSGEEKKNKRPRFIMGLLAILQTNPDFNYSCAAGCWDGGSRSVSQPLLTLMMDELVINSRPSLFFPPFPP